MRGSLFHAGKLGTGGKSVSGVKKMFSTNVFILLIVGRSAGMLLFVPIPFKVHDFEAGFVRWIPRFASQLQDVSRREVVESGCSRFDSGFQL